MTSATLIAKKEHMAAGQDVIQRLRNAARDGVKITRVAIDANVSPYKITLLTGDGIANPANGQPRRARLSILEINAINARLDAIGVPAVATW